MSKIFKIVICSFLLGIGLSANAQSGTVSPYSRFGLGDLSNVSTVSEFGMGGISLALTDSTRFHTGNPANLTNIHRTIFQFGVFGELVSLNSNTANTNRNTSNLNYMAIAFPVAKWWKTGISLNPFSSVGYEISERIEMDSIGGITNNYQGSGGLNKLEWSNAFMPIDGLSVGFAASYLFGSMDRSAIVRFDSTDFHNTNRLFRTNVNSLGIQLGVQYTYQLTEENNISFAGSYGLGNELKATRDELVYTFTEFSGFQTVKDTLSDKSSDGFIQLPSRLGFGAVYNHGTTWNLGAELSMQDWSNYRNFGESDSLSNSFTFAMGGSYTPNYRAVKSYLSTVTYRAGFHYGQTYLSLRNEALKDYGISFGFGLPLRTTRNTKNEVNIGFEFGKRGTLESNLIEENYFRFKVGVTLNDKWFTKRKID
jgi:hypothetical protein